MDFAEAYILYKVMFKIPRRMNTAHTCCMCNNNVPLSSLYITPQKFFVWKLSIFLGSVCTSVVLARVISYPHFSFLSRRTKSFVYIELHREWLGIGITKYIGQDWWLYGKQHGHHSTMQCSVVQHSDGRWETGALHAYIQTHYISFHLFLFLWLSTCTYFSLSRRARRRERSVADWVGKDWRMGWNGMGMGLDVVMFLGLAGLPVAPLSRIFLVGCFDNIPPGSMMIYWVDGWTCILAQYLIYFSTERRDMKTCFRADDLGEL